MLANASTSTITGLSFEWTNGNFTSLQVSWDPLTPPQGGRVTYRISYTPVSVNGTATEEEVEEANILLNDTITEEVVTSEVKESRVLLTDLDSNLFYSVTVEAIIQDAPSISANIGK